MEDTDTQARPVAHRGRMIASPDDPRKRVYQPENRAFRDQLCDRDEQGRLVGKNPMTLPLDVLTAAGHPRTFIQSVILRLRKMHGVDTGEMRHDGFLGLGREDFPKRLTAIRDVVCSACCDGNKVEIRRCAVYDCPAWAFRMGRNPHNPQRGINRFAKPEALSETVPENR